MHTYIITHSHASTEELYLGYIFAVPPGHWDKTGWPHLQWSINFSTALFMISVIENQHSEPSMQICHYNIQDGILFTICGRSVYLTVFMGRKVRCLSLVSHTFTQNGIVVQNIISEKGINIKSMYKENGWPTVCLCLCVIVKGTCVFINLMDPETRVIWKVRGQVKGVARDEVRICEGQRSHSSCLNSWYTLYINLLYLFLLFIYILKLY